MKTIGASQFSETILLARSVLPAPGLNGVPEPKGIYHPLLRQVANFLSVLLDDGGIGDDADNAIKLVLLGMVEGITHSGKCFAAAGRYGQRINSLWVIGPALHWSEMDLRERVNLMPVGK